MGEGIQKKRRERVSKFIITTHLDLLSNKLKSYVNQIMEEESLDPSHAC